ncbi:DNA topoisomerase II [Coprinopsis cinerea okayama7|uniref:DNA topoisomerase 2 n=1 Tax=Coprinopsis cinerea (strain Okayama-7 / 130 / ATCC MYA-4618 / FGSC 9003) TaxID=240176 RepID=A8NKQ4_COPC7|nr:DNA topoisomerase II [Coprinopsis cinerea okayama7\|eukprot:XP_001834519.2 DNA topoisomerase II [Coprinopsis cinerea okayama7\
MSLNLCLDSAYDFSWNDPIPQLYEHTEHSPESGGHDNDNTSTSLHASPHPANLEDEVEDLRLALQERLTEVEELKAQVTSLNARISRLQEKTETLKANYERETAFSDHLMTAYTSNSRSHARLDDKGVVRLSDDDEDSGMDTDEPTSAARRQEEPDEPLTQLEHILKRPDSYIGNIEIISTPMWTYDSETIRMVHREVKYVPGFFKIVDEILVNAADNKINDPSMDTLKITIDVEEGTISVYNNGRGIPIEIHSKEKMYIPEMIFGHLLTSTNYDDDEKKLTGGRNGYGAKLANIYSLEFTVETADKNTSQKYKQTWTDNMSKCGKAKITKNTRGEEYTRITFRPDLKRFGMNSINEDTVNLLKRRVFDMADTVKDVKVLLNDERLKKLLLRSREELPNRSKPQTKELLTLPSSKFGSKPTISDEFIKKVAHSGIVDNVLNWAKFKADQQMKRADGTKRSRLLGLAKLSDANNAGTRHAQDCTLILTEGDSAKALAIAGLGVVGRDNFGVFPLRGKLLNVREACHDQVMKNEEIQNIKKIMGLQHNKDYTNTSSLRYGRVMIMTDQDHDGSHIKGLIINFLDHLYPSLLKIPDFLVEFVTPLSGYVKKGNKVKDFFTIPEYEQWLEETPDARKWESKYYKGFSEDKGAREYFSKMEKRFHLHRRKKGTVNIDLAFSKKKADERKEWLRQYKPGTFLDHRLEEIPYSEFINKELILFSMANNVRSIPSIAYGLKPGQRKVIWGCFKRKLKKEIKVEIFARSSNGYISEHAAYHHGEASLAATIINLAQDFVGSNNLALLSPSLDDDVPIEPEWHMPTVPMVLINGAEGIGTGSRLDTNIPPYNPIDIVANIRRKMKGEELEPMTPWWRGFKGEVRPPGKGKYDVVGVATKINDTTVEISELPIHKWTRTFKDDLEVMITGEKKDKEKDKDKDEPYGKKDVVKNAGMVKDFKEHHGNLNVLFRSDDEP